MTRLFRTAVGGAALTVVLLAAWSGVADGATTTSAPTSAQPSNRAMYCPHGETPAKAVTAVNDLQPPTGFKPATASDADLAKYGFPLRPKGGNGAAWLDAMRAWKTKAPANSPAWTCGHESHGPVGSSQATVVPNGLGGGGSTTSHQWGGNQVSNSLVGDNYHDYPAAGLEMNLPYPTSGGGGGLYDEATFWTGIGMGYGSGSLIQNGVEMGQTGASSSYYAMFYQVFPQQNAQYVAPFTISGNDLLYFQSWEDGPTAYFYFANLSHGQSISYHEPFDGLSGDSAEWIVEKSGQEALSGWGPNNPFDMRAEFEDRNGGWFCAGTANHWSYHLLNTSNQDIAHGLAWVDPPSYCTFPLYRTSADGS